MAPFYGWSSTASRLEPLWGGSLLYNTKSLEIYGTHFSDRGRIKGWVDLGATRWFWKVLFLIFGTFLLVLTKFSFWQRGMGPSLSFYEV